MSSDGHPTAPGKHPFWDDPKAIAKAMGKAVQDTLRQHKLMGQPVVTWRDGQVVWIPPEEIKLTGEEVHVVRWKVPDTLPSPAPVDEATRDRLLHEYVSGVSALRQAITGMTREQLAARPVAGRWSTLEVVCHLADFEAVYADRIKRILADEQPPLFAADRDRFLTALAYQAREADEESATIEAIRRQIARILGACSPDRLSRLGIHTIDGPVTVEQVWSGAIEHLQHHLPHIREKRRVLGLPVAGS